MEQEVSVYECLVYAENMVKGVYENAKYILHTQCYGQWLI